jgi:preprotein translocase subunit SecF
MIDIIGKRKYFFALSILLIAIGIIGYVVNGVQLDIQFQGGTLMQIQMSDENYDTASVETIIGNELGKKVTAQKMQTFNPKDAADKINVLVLKVSKENTLTGEERNKVIEILRRDFGVQEGTEMNVLSVEPFIGKEMLQKGVQAALISSLLIILYVWWRFSVMSGLSAAIAAVLALLHDAAVMFSVYTVFNLPLNESFVAAILTILGYSINDTIIIYDRIRENSSLMKKSHVFELTNRSILQTISRSINTMLTTVISVATVYVFASVNNIQSLKEFTLPLIVGLLSGAYSSIFIAGPLWAIWKNSQARKKVASKAAKV